MARPISESAGAPPPAYGNTPAVPAPPSLRYRGQAVRRGNRRPTEAADGR